MKRLGSVLATITPLMILLLIAASYSPASHAVRADELIFGSKQDYFTLKRQGAKYTLDGDPVDLGTFKEFLPYFDVPLQFECPSLPKRPNLTVKAKVGDKTLTRHFYFANGTLSDGRACLEIAGQGIFFLPLHRHWFKTDTVVRTKIGEKINLSRNGQVFLSFKKEQGRWVNNDPDFFTNWEFFENFLRVVKAYKVDARIAPAITKSSTTYGEHSFDLQTGGKKYSFYHIGDKQWAAKLPKTPWLISSNSWSIFENMDMALWQAKRTGNLAGISDKSRSLDERIGAIEGLGGQWSRAIKKTLQDIMLDPSDKAELKLIAIARLRRHPSDDTMKVLAEALAKTNDSKVLYHISRTLRIRNPNGKTLEQDFDATERAPIIENWQKWAREL